MKELFKLYRTSKRVKFAIKFSAFCAVAAMTVYSLVPKYDKIEGVTEEGFLKNSECGIRDTE